MYGIACELVGRCSETEAWMTKKDRRHVIPSETFSPDSGGRGKVNSPRTETTVKGMMTVST